MLGTVSGCTSGSGTTTGSLSSASASDSSQTSVSASVSASTEPAVSISASASTDASVSVSASEDPSLKEPDPDAFILDIVKNMTLEEKVAQMTVPAFNVWDENVSALFAETNPGGVILFAKNIKSEEDLTNLTNALKNLSGDRPKMFISIDQEGGIVQRITFSKKYPKAADIGAKGSKEASFQNGFEIGTELAKYGINVDFAPVMDVNSNPDNPVIGNRSFSDNPDVVSEMGIAMMQGLNKAGVIACLKHFPGHGDTSTDSHTSLPVVNKTMEELLKTELIPFQAGIDAGADMIMTAHIEFPNVVTEKIPSVKGKEITPPATMSREIITDLLRTELGFDGVVITDALEMKAVSGNFSLIDATMYSVNAGVDLMLIPMRVSDKKSIDAYKTYLSDFAALVKDGKIPEERIDESISRILKLKNKYGFFDE